MKLSKLKLSLIILIFLGFIFRIWFLSSQSLWMDESFTLNAAIETLEKGYPLLDSGVFYGGSLLNIYLISGFISIFPDIFGARLVSVLFGTLMILLSFYIGREFFDRRAGFIFAFFMAFSYWEILWSRQARMYMQLQFFYFLSLYLFYRFTQTKSRKVLIYLILSTLAAFFSHSFGYSLLGVFSLYILIAHFKSLKKFNFKKYINYKTLILSLVFLTVLIYFLPGIFNYLF